MRIGIVGGGLTGLSAAFRLSQRGHRVIVFEKESLLGGLAAGFKKNDWAWSLENFPHHFFTSDIAAKRIVSELDLTSKLFFKRPKSSIFYRGQISQFDSPFSVLRFPHLSLTQKIRTGLITAYLKATPDWQKFEKITATQWLHENYGEKAYQILWEPLLASKFGLFTDQVSMSWFWARIKKRSTRLGYLQGGFQLLIDKLAEKINKNHGKIFLNTTVRDLDLSKKFDKVIVTAPTQKFFPKTKLPEMLGAVYLILILKKHFLTDGTYWLNINEPGFPFVAAVEHTNFIEPKFYNGNRLLYVGGYYSQSHRYFKMTKEQIFKEFLPYLLKINPKFNQLSVISYRLSTNLDAQPIMPANYSQIMPSFQTKVPKVFLANMQMIHPWDRGTNYAIELGEKITDEISH